MDRIRESFKDMDDLIVRETRLAAFPDIRLALVYIKGMSDTASLQQGFLSERGARPHPDAFIDQDVVDYIKEAVLNLSETEEIRDFDALNTAIMSGDAVILAEGHALALAVGMKGGDRRGVEEPNTQSVIRGPRQGFTETIGINTTLVRRIIKDTRLRMESRQLGRITKTKVVTMYIQALPMTVFLKKSAPAWTRLISKPFWKAAILRSWYRKRNLLPFLRYSIPNVRMSQQLGCWKAV